MTREEAIWYLSPIAESAALPRYKEALGMAIAALKELGHLEAEYNGLKWRHARAMEQLQGTNSRNVVFCEECLYGQDAAKEVFAPLYRCRNSGILNPPDHFCGYGRRKADVPDKNVGNKL